MLILVGGNWKHTVVVFLHNTGRVILLFPTILMLIQDRLRVVICYFSLILENSLKPKIKTIHLKSNRGDKHGLLINDESYNR